MNIVGVDSLLFGVDDVAGCAQYLIDYGLRPSQGTGDARCYSALDGTNIQLLPKNDSSLPAEMDTASMLRKTTYGVADDESLRSVAKELERDRPVKWLPDGSIESVDDMGFVLGFQMTCRSLLTIPAEQINAPGSLHRPPNHVAVDENLAIYPRSLSHVVYFVPDAARAEAFYVERLQFRCTDRFIATGPFLQPSGSLEHHCLFMIETPPHMKGCEHFTFHLGGPTELMQAGTRFVNKGYQSFWGPGRHRFGSNWFWYFNSPLGCHVEYDADMDLHDASWVPREGAISADASQLFLFQRRDKWFPGGPPPTPGTAS